MTLDLESLKKLATTVRMLSADGVEKAKSGHPGLPMGAADFSTVLWSQFLRFDAKDPHWANRDRFVLSAGHGSMLLYSLLHLFGFDLPMDQLKQFRQWDSKTPGHPEFGWTAGVEATTGPLGQGSANSVGLALSQKMLAARYGSDLFNARVYALVSDGDLMEGLSAEAGSLAGHLGLGNLVYLYDDNLISLAAETKVCFTESVPKRYEAYGWYVQQCDGHNMEEVAKCIANANAQSEKPSIICCRTIIGKGSPHKEHTYEVHGAPLGADELKATKKNLGWPEEPMFYVPDDMRAFCAAQVELKAKEAAEWRTKFSAWQQKNPELAKQYDEQANRKVPTDLKEELLAAFKEPKKDATRNLSGTALQVIAKKIPYLVGGSADLDPSTKTAIKDGGSVQKNAFEGRNIFFGVREHAMGSIVNGLALTGAWIPYSATFLVFSDYMRPVMRLASLSHIQSLFIFTHDSFWVGEDGPTHEPIEHVMSLRLIPRMHVYRPADGLEVAMCYYAALMRKDGPSTFIFSRQNLTPLDRPASFKPDDVLKGAYVVHEAKDAKAVLVSTGSELNAAVEAAKQLAAEGKPITVVSMPCAEVFLEQDEAYKQKILPKNLPRITLEAGSTLGWDSIVGGNALTLGLDHFGASAPGEVLAEKFGFTAEKVKERILKGWSW